jgi:NAD(P)-dependent dehydrogenase (short-subunit alcohol dehydrogenase family)
VLLDQSQRRKTKDGNELTFGTNHLGDFALTHWLAPLLSAAHGSRVVTTASFTGKSARLDLDDLQTTRDYQPKRAYERSKLAQMLVGFELDRRLRAAGSTTLSVVSHPGGALDSLTPPRPPVQLRTTGERPRGLPAGFSSKARKPPRGPPSGQSWTRPSVAARCRDPGCSEPGETHARTRPRSPGRHHGRGAPVAASSDLTGVEPSFSPG